MTDRPTFVGETAADRRETYAIIAGSVIFNARDAECLRLYAYLDYKQGTRGRITRGYQTVADALGLQARTIRVHAEHLAEDGLIELRSSNTRTASTKAEMRVRHNPGRPGRASQDVQLPERLPRYRSPSKIEKYLGNEHPPVLRNTHRIPLPDNRPVLRDTHPGYVRDMHEQVQDTHEHGPRSPAFDAGLSLSTRSEWSDIPTVDSHSGVTEACGCDSGLTTWRHEGHWYCNNCGPFF